MSADEIMSAVVAIVLGLGLVTYLGILTRRAVVRQRQLTARRGDPGSQQALEDYIREIDQATSDAEINRLDQERKGDG